MTHQNQRKGKYPFFKKIPVRSTNLCGDNWCFSILIKLHKLTIFFQILSNLEKAVKCGGIAMYLEYQRINTFYCQTTLREVKNSLSNISFPLVIENQNHEILGVLSERQFWKGAALNGWDEKVELFKHLY